MRRLLHMVVVLALVGLSDSAYSQSPDILEGKYGFQIFKFGTGISEHQQNLGESVFNARNNPLVKSYTYTGDCCQVLFGVEVEDISLAYYKNVLFQVTVNFFLFSEEEHRKVLFSLEQLFGKPLSVGTLGNPGLEGGTSHIWKSDRVQLELIRYKEMGEWMGYMLVQEHRIFTRSLTDEF